jgi:colanic acid biosynthesis glycosyl transferase WcaI
VEKVLGFMSVKVMLLTQWFYPEPTPKGLSFAKELVSQGFDVEVVTGFPNYPTGVIYPGYTLSLIAREEIEGIRITRLPLYPNHDSSAFKRVFNYVSFGFSALVYGLFFAKRTDVIYAYHPPLTTGIAAVLIRLFRRTPVVYDIQDIWPDTLAATGMVNNKKILNYVSYFCNWVYKYVDTLVVLSPGFKELLSSRGVNKDKIEVIYNWCDEEALSKSTLNSPQEFSDKNKFRILFAGNIGKAQALECIVAVAEQLYPITPTIEFVFLGTGIALEQLKRTVVDKNIQNIQFIPAVSMQETGKYLNAADVLLVHLKNNPLFKITIPSKTQAYMAIGKPILMAVVGNASELINQANCGINAIPEDSDSIAQAVLKLATMRKEDLTKMGLRGKAFYDRELSVKNGVTKFSAIFRSQANKKHKV